MAEKEHLQVVARHRKARHLYVIEQELECGISLVGTEVKSLRGGQTSIAEAYGRIRDDELYLIGATIPEYAHGGAYNHEKTRDRKLLLHRREIEKWSKRVREKGITIVPLEIYFRDHLVKVKMALVRGKKAYDKRESDKARSAQRDIDRAMSRRR